MKQIDDIRRDNLKRLADKVGGIAALAGALKRSDAQVSQWIRGPPHSVTGKPRGMKSVTARWIETTTELPPGWLDQNHEASRSRPEMRNSSPALPKKWHTTTCPSIFAFPCSPLFKARRRETTPPRLPAKQERPHNFHVGVAEAYYANKL